MIPELNQIRGRKGEMDNKRWEGRRQVTKYKGTSMKGHPPPLVKSEIISASN